MSELELAAADEIGFGLQQLDRCFAQLMEQPNPGQPLCILFDGCALQIAGCGHDALDTCHNHFTCLSCSFCLLRMCLESNVVSSNNCTQRIRQ